MVPFLRECLDTFRRGDTIMANSGIRRGMVAASTFWLLAGSVAGAQPVPSSELEALRRLPAHVFGVLMSLEPAAAAVAGLIVLGQVLKANEWAGMALVIVASAGATRTARTPAPRDA